MPTTLRVLILEDRPEDCDLMLHELREAGFDPVWRRVDTEADYLGALSPDLDVILADYALSGFDASRALRHWQEVQSMNAPRLNVPSPAAGTRPFCNKIYSFRTYSSTLLYGIERRLAVAGCCPCYVTSANARF